MNNAMRKIGRAVAVLGLMVGMAGQVKASVTINFDDGTAGSPVGSFYSGLGVTFSNADFTSNFGLPGSSGPLGINSISNLYQPTATNPIEALFSSGQSSVSITGIDVGDQGIRIDAYDIGGNLLASDQFIGTGVGVGTFATITVASASIRRVDIYQPIFTGSGDGVLFDDFTFSADAVAVPEPATLASAGIAGLMSLGLVLRRRRRAIA